MMRGNYNLLKEVIMNHRKMPKKILSRGPVGEDISDLDKKKKKGKTVVIKKAVSTPRGRRSSVPGSIRIGDILPPPIPVQVNK